MNILSIIGNLLGIGKDALSNRAKLKQAKLESNLKVIEARANAQVTRINSNTVSDNQLDLMAKEEVITYLFLVPVFIATVTPFIIAYKSNDFTNLSEDIKISYENLDKLPQWYKWVLGAIVIDVLGFRSFARKIIDKFINKYSKK